MIKEVTKDNKKVFMCEECCLAYKDKQWAEKCESWCKKYNSCNLKITFYAIKGKKMNCECKKEKTETGSIYSISKLEVGRSE